MIGVCGKQGLNILHIYIFVTFMFDTVADVVVPIVSAKTHFSSSAVHGGSTVVQYTLIFFSLSLSMDVLVFAENTENWCFASGVHGGSAPDRTGLS